MYGIDSGEEVTLVDVDGPGVIRHIWMTLARETDAGQHVFRDVVLRMYWDGEETPSVEVPVGDFFCNGQATPATSTRCPSWSRPTGA